MIARSMKRGQVKQPEKFNAPLFRSLIEGLSSRERWIVLDLGAARTQTIKLFSQHRCRLDIADMADEISELNALPEQAQVQQAVHSMLPANSNETTNMVLCWDMLNYLERPVLKTVMSHIAARGKPGTLVHALIFYSHTHMPSQPGCYVPQEDNSLLDVATSLDERPAPRYSPDDLKQCLSDYSIERAMLLGNGMQEFLFRLQT